MEFRPVREKDGGPVVNWVVDKVHAFGVWLIHVTANRALMYQADISEDDLDLPESCSGSCKDGCCGGSGKSKAVEIKGAKEPKSKKEQK